MTTANDSGSKILDFPLVDPRRARGPAPERFYERFEPAGTVRAPGWSRITSEASERLFERRSAGLRILFINAPIREWSYPNILPIGHAYVAAVAAMDGHTVDVLDLNAERRQPVKDPATVFQKWVDDRIVAFVKAYVALVREDAGLKERLKDQFVEDPVTKIRFPKYLASSTLERDGKTYYFVD